jgi:predicted RecA/RadA family phage recombinase
MKNVYRVEADTIPLVMAAAVTSGQLVAVGNFVGVCACDAKIGDSVEVLLEGEVIIPKLAADVFAQGAAVTFDPASGIAQAAGTRIAGTATRAAASGEAVVYVRLVQKALTVPAAEETGARHEPAAAHPAHHDAKKH